MLAPLTTGSTAASFRLAVDFAGRPGLILLDQLRTVDKRRLVRRLGTIKESLLSQVLAALRDIFED